MKQISRRAFTLMAAKFGIGAGAFSLFGAACQQIPGMNRTPSEIRIGINGGQQPLFRYVAARRDELLKPLGHTVRYVIFPNEAEIRAAFKRNELDVIATLLPQAALINLDDVPVQVFGAIGWVAETLPIVVYSGADPQKTADLKGLRIAVAGKDDPGFAYYRAFSLANDRFRLDTDVVLVEKTANYSQMMVGNPTADAWVATGGEWNLMRAEGNYRPLTTLGLEWQRFAPNRPPVIFGALVARRQWIGQNTKFINDFVKATADGFAAYKSDKDAYIRRITQQNPEGFPGMNTSDGVNISNYLGMEAVTADRVRLDGGDVDDIAKLLEAMAVAGALPRTMPNVKDFVFTSR